MNKKKKGKNIFSIEIPRTYKEFIEGGRKIMIRRENNASKK